MVSLFDRLERFFDNPGPGKPTPVIQHTVFTIAVSYMLYSGSGLVTVTVVGIWLVNMRDVDVDEILNFKESLSILLISFFFILLAARVDFAAFANLGWKAFL